MTEPLKLAAEKGAQPGFHQHRVQSHGQRPELPCDLFSATPRLRIPLSHKGCDDLLHEAYFTIGGRAKSAQVAGLQTEPAHLGNSLGVIYALSVGQFLPALIGMISIRLDTDRLSSSARAMSFYLVSSCRVMFSFGF